MTRLPTSLQEIDFGAVLPARRCDEQFAYQT